MLLYLTSRLIIDMKNILLIFSCLAILSCQNKTTSTNTVSDSTVLAETGNVTTPGSVEKNVLKDSLPYQIIHFYKATKKSSIPKDSSKYAYVKADYPKFADKQKFLNNQVLNIITAEPWTGNKSNSIDKAAESFFKEYLAFKKEVPESPAGYEWDENLKVSFQDKDLVVLASDSYFYTGGAHGMNGLSYFNLDIKSAKELKLKDLLNAGYEPKLTDIAEQIFRKDEGLSKDEPLDNYFFENNIFILNENFAITPKGLLFTYNPYEIKSYAEGRTNLLIPYARITNLIKPNSFISKYVNK